MRCSYKPEFIADTALQPDGVVAPITLIYRTLHFVDVHERKKRAQTVTGLDESKHGLGPVEVLIRHRCCEHSATCLCGCTVAVSAAASANGFRARAPP